MNGPVTLQYYYQGTKCPARSPEESCCTCWHDEGKGPFPSDKHCDPATTKTWRVKPN